MPILEWTSAARSDLIAIIDFISSDNASAASVLFDEIIEKTEALVSTPKLYKPGRVKGTREMVVRPNFIVVYSHNARAVTVLRVLHAARNWP